MSTYSIYIMQLYDSIYNLLLVRYTPSFCKELKLMVEYDTRGWNMGAAMRFWKHLSVNVFTREFTCVSAGLRYECTLMH